MLKSDLHIHSAEDNFHSLSYDAKDLIDHAKNNGFEVLAITLHRDVFSSKKIFDYAKKKGILLLQGTERYVEGKEVLMYNVTQSEVEKITTFNDLRALKKKKDVLVIAPHPYFKRKTCLDSKLVENIDVFDAIEYCHFYIPFLNFNKKAVRVSQKYNIPLIGTSDAHNLWQMNFTFSLVDSKKDMKSFFSAIRNKQVMLVTKPLPIYLFFWRLLKMSFE